MEVRPKSPVALETHLLFFYSWFPNMQLRQRYLIMGYELA